MRALVIGRGVFGLASALALARLGHQVVVVGPRDPGAASEDRSRIIRNDYAADEFHRAWAEEAIEGWRQWNAAAGRPLFHRVGLANLTQAPMEERPFAGGSFAHLAGASRLDAAAISDAFAFLTPGRFVDGYLNPAAGWADASEALRFLERSCEDAGVGIVPEPVARIGDGWIGLMDDGLLRADRIVVATGAWTPGLVAETDGLLVPAGQPVLYLQPQQPERFAGGPVWALDLEANGFYGFPVSPDGIVKVGHHGPGITRRIEVRAVPERVIEEFKTFFRGTAPELARARVAKTRVCFYCEAPHGRFLIDQVPGRKRLVVAAGGSGHGFKFAPVVGEVVAAVVLGQDHARRAAVAWREPGPAGDAARSPGLGGTPR